MATFTANANHEVSFYTFDIAELDGDILHEASATTWRTGPDYLDDSTNVEFQGVGFTYFGGALTGGTINSITKHTNGAIDYQFTGLSLSGAAFHDYLANGNSYDFLSAALNGNDTITGSNYDDFLMGFNGNDHIEGLNGDNSLDGGAGSDTLVGGKGDDTYVIDSAGDVIQEKGVSGGDRVFSTISVDLTKAAFDGIEHVTLSGVVNINATGDSALNMIHGNAGNNKLLGNAGNDQLGGGDGNDTLDGGTGGDQMAGGAGNDTYYVDSAVDSVSESTLLGADLGGKDTVFSSIKTFTLPDYFENLTLTGTAQTGNGNDLANTLIGTASDNWLNGKAGADTMTGGGGNDTYTVDDTKDKVTETSTGGTNDVVYSFATYTLSSYVEKLFLYGFDDIDGKGNGSDNQIFGNGSDNAIDGAGGNDYLDGGWGDDSLVGGGGNDHMTGGKGDDTLDTSLGNDTVLYESKADGYDVILGFDGNATGGQDKLNLNGYFDDLGVDLDDRNARVGVADYGGVVDVWIDTDDNGSLDHKIAEIHTVDVIKVGEDIDTFYLA